MPIKPCSPELDPLKAGFKSGVCGLLSAMAHGNAAGGQRTPSDASGLESVDTSEFTSSEWEGPRWDSAPALSSNMQGRGMRSHFASVQTLLKTLLPALGGRHAFSGGPQVRRQRQGPSAAHGQAFSSSAALTVLVMLTQMRLLQAICGSSEAGHGQECG